jgi:hypothetical protein
LLCILVLFLFLDFLFSTALNLITTDDPAQPIVTAANCLVVESTIKFMVDHLQMRMRKHTFEEEA